MAAESNSLDWGKTFLQNYTSASKSPILLKNGPAVMIPPLHLDTGGLERKLNSEKYSIMSQQVDSLIPHLFEKKLPFTVDDTFVMLTSGRFRQKPIFLSNKLQHHSNTAYNKLVNNASDKSNETQIAEWLNLLGDSIADIMGIKTAADGKELQQWYGGFANTPVAGGLATVHFYVTRCHSGIPRYTQLKRQIYY